MGKLDQLRELGGRNVAESTGAPRNDGLPPGMDLDRAAGMPARLVGLAKEKGAARIPVDRIVRDETQPREEFDDDALSRLAESLRTKGQLQPIRVRWEESRGVYVVLLGERRWRAARMAGLPELSCIIHDGDMTDADRLGLQMVENCLREDLKPIEQGRAYKSLMQTHGWSTRQLAEELQIGQTSVVRALALLDLPASIQDQVEQGSIPATVAHEIVKLPDDALQSQVARAVVEQDLTRSEVGELVRSLKANRGGSPPASKPEPVSFDLGDAVVQIRWRKGDAITAVQALRKALKLAQEQSRDEVAA